MFTDTFCGHLYKKRRRHRLPEPGELPNLLTFTNRSLDKSRQTAVDSPNILTLIGAGHP
ncbi:hypothetical protein AWB68_02198 [Caballeronia choica]|uniref:Uncharacterized protein n=1 Tax=Caballeronia choica TaxID=326476 RepID=A0A158HP96_9BURK|nr:hypothetical protein AWB68_02198 [Caballeronia choica]